MSIFNPKPAFPVLNRSYMLSNDFVLAMPMYEGSDQSDINDLSGYNNNGILTGCSFVDSHFGWALDLNGTSDWVNIPHDSLLDYTAAQPKTISFWFKMKDLTGSQMILSKWFGVGTRNYLIWTSGTSLVVGINGAGFAMSTIISADVWYHVVVRLNSSGVGTLFVNSILRGTSAALTPFTTTTASLRIGQSGGAQFGNFTIANLYMWNRVLAVKDITWLYYDAFYMFRITEVTDYLHFLPTWIRYDSVNKWLEIYVDNIKVATFKKDTITLSQNTVINNEAETPKVKITAIGGIAIKLTNQTGANTVQGQTVKSDIGSDDAVILTASNDNECMGVFLDSGVADGEETWVVVSGIAAIAMGDNEAATHGNWVETNPTEAGYADATSASPAASPQHFNEIAHCIETVAAGGIGTHILARCVLHFN